jgi:hypothetical protein
VNDKENGRRSIPDADPGNPSKPAAPAYDAARRSKATEHRNILRRGFKFKDLSHDRYSC